MSVYFTQSFMLSFGLIRYVFLKFLLDLLCFLYFVGLQTKYQFWRQVLSMKAEMATLWMNSMNICGIFLKHTAFQIKGI